MDDGKGPEEELLDDSKADSHRKPTDHGALVFEMPVTSELTEAERYHAWTFELHDDARVEMTTSYAVRGQRRTDTVLYLYRETASGWGAYVARNDDYASTTYSQLVRDLGAGRYRVLVKGYDAATRGKFKVTVDCEGAGCAVPSGVCLFGSTYNDIATNAALETVNTTLITQATLATLSAEDQQKLVLAVRQSSHTDVTTATEALARVDQQEMNVIWLVEPAARRGFIAFEYGAGDNSYGAIFERLGGAMVTSIHDGDLYDCTVEHETCLLPEDWAALRMDPAFTRTSARVVTAANQLAGMEAAQALATFKRVYPDVVNLAEGLAHADDHQLNVQSFRHTTGKQVTVFELGAGDTSVGAIFHAGTLDLAGVISDLFIDGCSLFVD